MFLKLKMDGTFLKLVYCIIRGYDMIKKIVLMLIMLTGMQVFAADNYLNSVVIENLDGKTSVILRTDEVARVKKDVTSPDKLMLTLKDVSRSVDLNTLYKNTSEVKGLIVQDDGNDDLKIYIEAPEISKAEVVFDTPNSSPVVVDAGSPSEIVWGIVSVFLLIILGFLAQRITAFESEPDINEIIKEREKALYRNFQKEVASIPSINYKLKSYRKHVLKGETLRSYGEKLVKAG